ncbi:MAG: deoxyribonuclease IV [Verrucomicrobia bacterium]|jgi:deoxyribonuclease-4|nr:MAG: deoxyribonuclease IV [Verrucomicrobiota bacterium]MDH4470406.1 deoxyribonuclease IV [Verrucomicrobiae bacterium]
MLLLGSHISTQGGPSNAIERAVHIGCTAMQIFVKNNMQWHATPFTEAEATAFTQHPLHNKLGAIVAHAGYLINLGVEKTINHEKSLLSLAQELIRCEQLHIPFLVLHPGSHLGAGAAHGIRCVVESLNQIHADHPNLQVRIALETTAGQGSCLGSSFKELASILEQVSSPDRLRICLDTAHVFAAGYDLSSPQGAEKVFHEFDRIVGLHQLCVLHINESKASLGSRVDRHDNLGQGKIGLEAFRWIMQAEELAPIPKILETPKGKDLVEDVVAMKLLRSFIPNFL